MITVHKHIIIPIAASLIFAMLSVSFLTIPEFFNGLITAKQYGIEVIALFAGLLFFFGSLKRQQIQFTSIDITVTLFAIWYLVNELVSGNNYIPSNQIFFNLFLWGFIYMFVRQHAGDDLFIAAVAIGWMAVMFLQSALGLLQLYGWASSNHRLFSITGTFHNPGPFSGFVVSALPLAIVGYKVGPPKWHGGDTVIHRKISLRGIKFSFGHQKIFSGILRAVSLLTILSVLLVIPAAQSRAAWVAAFVGSIYVLWSCRKRFPFINRLSVRYKRLSKTLRILLITGSLIFTLGAATGIYLLKKDSANGRLLIWQVSSQLIKKHPIIGHGCGAFSNLYMDEQARWFKNGKGTDEHTLIAGSPESPFNEFLKLWIEKGLVGVILAAGILTVIFFPKIFHTTRKILNVEGPYIFSSPSIPINGRLPIPVAENEVKEPEKKSTQHTTQSSDTHFLLPGFKGALLSLLTFSLFSYPFEISSFTLLLVIVVAILSSATPLLIIIKEKRTFRIAMPLVIFLIVVAAWYFPKRQEYYKALKIWQQANLFYNMRSYDMATKAYEEAFPILNSNGLFLQMYGKALSMNHQHIKSNKILALAQKHYSSYIIQNTLGDNHKALGNYIKAEKAYKNSTYMVPSLLLPKYLLAKLYIESGETEKAKKAALEVLNSPVKIKSTATNEIMKEMRNTLTSKQETINTIPRTRTPKQETNN